jgi:DNA-binding SARP family transcriptional activator
MESLRDDLRSRVLDALARLAEARDSSGATTEALAALDRAIAIDPYAEELYKRKIRIQASVGLEDAARRTLDILTARLDELGLDPEDETRTLACRTDTAAAARSHRGPA